VNQEDYLNGQIAAVAVFMDNHSFLGSCDGDCDEGEECFDGGCGVE